MTGNDVTFADKYVPLLELGRGGMAVVYLSVIRGPGGFQKLQVVKRLRRDIVAEAPELLQMFLDEARIAARINHPNVVQTNEVGEDLANHFIAMEYLEGQSLNVVVREAKEALTLPIHLRIICDVLAGLHAAHELTDFDGTPLNIVHRDVSPHNVIVTYSGVAKLVDFGIAKAADSHAETKSGVVKGKYPYMAPEQFLGGGIPIDRRADIYAVGVLLWQALTGRRLWPRGTEEAEIMMRVAKGDVPRPSVHASSVPSELEEICMKALGNHRSERWESASAMQVAIERYLDTLDSRPRDAEIATFMTTTFAKERETLRSAIQARMSEQSSRGEVPVPHLTSIVPTASHSSPTLDSLSQARRVDDEAQTRSLASTISQADARIPGSVRRPAWVVPALVVAAVVGAFIVGRRGTNETSSPAHDPSGAPIAASVAPSSGPEPKTSPSGTTAEPAEAAIVDASAAQTLAPATATTSTTARPAVTAAPKSPVAAPTDAKPTSRKPKVDDGDPWKK